MDNPRDDLENRIADVVRGAGAFPSFQSRWAHMDGAPLHWRLLPAAAGVVH